MAWGGVRGAVEIYAEGWGLFPFFHTFETFACDEVVASSPVGGFWEDDVVAVMEPGRVWGIHRLDMVWLPDNRCTGYLSVVVYLERAVADDLDQREVVLVCRRGVLPRGDWGRRSMEEVLACLVESLVPEVFEASREHCDWGAAGNTSEWLL